MATPFKIHFSVHTFQPEESTGTYHKKLIIIITINDQTRQVLQNKHSHVTFLSLFPTRGKAHLSFNFTSKE
ncbi:hypothetical protein NC651_016694 [Populus alba x Populus x berolinensis]|nr:hypothetical protein NC651_016694 [Populus alba x Populus x berolinensis]